MVTYMDESWLRVRAFLDMKDRLAPILQFATGQYRMATPRATLTSRSFYGSSSSTSGCKGPKLKRQRLSGLNLVKSLQVTDGENLNDLGMTLSSDDEKSESTNDGGGSTSIQHDPESSEDDPAGELELSFNLSMYSFDDPASLTDHSSSQSVSRSSTPAIISHF